MHKVVGYREFKGEFLTAAVIDYAFYGFDRFIFNILPDPCLDQICAEKYQTGYQDQDQQDPVKLYSYLYVSHNASLEMSNPREF